MKVYEIRYTAGYTDYSKKVAAKTASQAIENLQRYVKKNQGYSNITVTTLLEIIKIDVYYKS